MISTVTLWRIARETVAHRSDDLSGVGAAKIGNRWNHVGTPMVYSATHISLAALELAAHIGKLAVIRNLFLVRIAIPVDIWDARQTVSPIALPVAWTSVPASQTSMDFGTAWAKGKASALLEVPSVIVPEENNVVINPVHADASKISAVVVRQFLFDARLQK